MLSTITSVTPWERTTKLTVSWSDACMYYPDKKWFKSRTSHPKFFPKSLPQDFRYGRVVRKNHIPHRRIHTSQGVPLLNNLSFSVECLNRPYLISSPFRYRWLSKRGTTAHIHPCDTKNSGVFQNRTYFHILGESHQWYFPLGKELPARFHYMSVSRYSLFKI